MDMIERYRCKEIDKIFSEENRWKKRLLVEAVVADTQYEMGIIPEKITEKLLNIKIDINRINEIEKEIKHDINAFVFFLVENLPDYADSIHYGLTSYDIVDNANALMLKQAIEYIEERLKELEPIFYELSLKYKYTKMMGRTHGVHAEPITFGVKLLGLLSELRRNLKRVSYIKEEISYGKISGTVGTYTMLSVELEKKALEKLNLKVEPVSTQVIPRDRYANLFSVLNLIATMFERIALQIRLLQRTETDEVAEPFRRKQTGSSAMPHKKNPVRCERITGLVRLLRGFLISAFENVALWDERDISHSSVERIILPDAFHIVCFIISEMKDIVKNLVVKENKMLKNVSDEKIFSQRLLLKLMKKGMSRNRAYRIVQRNTLGGTFFENVKKDQEIRELLSEQEIDNVFDIESFYQSIDKIYERMGVK